jgi:hypothetical protein
MLISELYCLLVKPVMHIELYWKEFTWKVVMMALDAFSFPSTDLFDSIPL